MSEELEEPERPGRTDARLLVVGHHRAVGRRAPRDQQVSDHPEKSVERRRVGVDEAHPEEIEMRSSGDVTGAKDLRRPEVE